LKEVSVSIPHRYCKNNNNIFFKITIDSMFQFLIGTVKTKRAGGLPANWVYVSIPHRYCKNIILETP